MRSMRSRHTEHNNVEGRGDTSSTHLTSAAAKNPAATHVFRLKALEPTSPEDSVAAIPMIPSPAASSTLAPTGSMSSTAPSAVQEAVALCPCCGEAAQTETQTAQNQSAPGYAAPTSPWLDSPSR
eukprot:CAMPEP_0178378616 /NCGR_PEP_ID=MMETSP0689_2-20121128/4521_1 /TAXON_ID=160604 /ORGANISM="Amphidinium massartii, Strain CS-259" /LENGTH=124 /DNA_ID=CAMNT_0019998697 /DNA_START=65 /DNA_END=440 /DNA_ORIENTATION=+